MRALASLLCGFIFGWGLLVSGMMRPDKVLGFLESWRSERQLGPEPGHRDGGWRSR